MYQLKADVKNMSTLLEKLSVSIEKMTEVSSNISQLLAVQSTRIQQQEKSTDRLSVELEASEKACTMRLDALERDMHKELEASRKNLSEKVTAIERWIWIVSGGAMVVGVIFSKITTAFLKL